MMTDLYKIRNLHLLSLFVVLQGCQTSNHNNTLVAKQDVVVTIDGSEPKKLAAEEKLPLDSSKPVLVESPGYLSAMIVPVQQNNSELVVSLRKWQDWGGPEYDRAISTIVSDVISSVIEIQMLLPAKRSDEALQKMEILQSKYPNMSYLNFLKASCYVVKGDLEKAKVSLRLALKDFPNDPHGLALKKQLLDSSERTAP